MRIATTIAAVVLSATTAFAQKPQHQFNGEFPFYASQNGTLWTTVGGGNHQPDGWYVECSIRTWMDADASMASYVFPLVTAGSTKPKDNRPFFRFQMKKEVFKPVKLMPIKVRFTFSDHSFRDWVGAITIQDTRNAFIVNPDPQFHRLFRTAYKATFEIEAGRFEMKLRGTGIEAQHAVDCIEEYAKIMENLKAESESHRKSKEPDWRS